MRAAEDLLAITRKLKQLWILSEQKKEESGEQGSRVEERLEVNDVARELQRILLREEKNEEMDGVQQNNDFTEELLQF